MVTPSESTLQTVVSPFQIKLIASVAELFGRKGVPFSVEVEYHTSSADGRVGRKTSFAAPGMPFDLHVTILSATLAVDIHPDAAVSYEHLDGVHCREQWEARYESYNYDNLDDLSSHVLTDLSQRVH